MNDEAEGPVSGRVPSRARLDALVAGSTGLVGSAVTELLARDPRVSVTALVRSKKGREGVNELVFDYESDDAYEALSRESYDLLFLCLGTTRKKAGSDKAFRRVDLDYPTRILDALAPAKSLKAIGLVSSVGADTGRGLYLGTKLELEQRVAASNVRHVIVRPSFLVGPREEFRLGERIGLATVAPILKGLGAISSGMKKYAPIRADEVATALVGGVMSSVTAPAEDPSRDTGLILEGKELFRLSTPSSWT